MKKAAKASARQYILHFTSPSLSVVVVVVVSFPLVLKRREDGGEEQDHTLYKWGL